MGKKSKKGKPEKLKKKKRGSESGEEEDSNPNIPFPGSDRTKARLARLLVILCAIGLGLAIYTIHYIRFVAVQKQQAAAQAAAEASSEPPAGEIFFLRPDGTYVYGDGGEPTLPGNVNTQNSTTEGSSGDAEASAEGETEASEGGETQDGSEAENSGESGEAQASEST